MRRDTATTAILVLTGLFLAGFVVQLFLASIGMMGAGSYEAHKTVGGTIMHLISLLVLIAAVAGANRARDWPWGLGFFVLVTVGIILAGSVGSHPWVAVFHPVLMLAATALAGVIHLRAHRAGEAAPRRAAV